MNRIKDILKEKGITQIELADKLGVSRSSIVKTLAGNPSQETLEKISSAIEVPMWQLFASPSEVQKENDGGYKCPNCGYPLKIKVE